MPHSILHLVNQSPFNNHRLKECLQRYAQGDAIILFDEGVYAALDNQTHTRQLQQCCVYVIEDDLHTRGLDKADVITSGRLINYVDFVQLTTQYKLIQSWY